MSFPVLRKPEYQTLPLSHFEYITPVPSMYQENTLKLHLRLPLIDITSQTSNKIVTQRPNTCKPKKLSLDTPISSIAFIILKTREELSSKQKPMLVEHFQAWEKPSSRKKISAIPKPPSMFIEPFQALEKPSNKQNELFLIPTRIGRFMVLDMD